MTPAEVADAAWAIRRARELARTGYPPLPRPGRARRPAAAAAAVGAVFARFAHPHPTPPAQRSAIGTARAGVFPAGVEAPADREAPARPSSQPLSPAAPAPGGQLSLGGLR